MTANLFTDHLGLAAPILQAPMAGSQGFALAAAVCEAGGLGAIPAAMHSPESLDAELQALRGLTARPFNVNFFCHVAPTAHADALARWHAVLTPYYRELGLDAEAMPQGPGRTPFGSAFLPVLAAHRPAVVSFHFGLPAPELLEAVQALGCRVWSSATTVAEARWLEARGVDAVIAQGLEAGGHRGHFLSEDLTQQMGTLALLPQVVEAVSLPVIAAGGIADAAGIRAARALGAQAVQMGTAWLCTPEATTGALHRAVLQSPSARHTALTRLFSGRPARGVVNRLMRELGPMHEAAPAFPLATAAIAPLRAGAEALGRTDFTPLWAGQNTQGCVDVPAGTLTQRLIAAWHGASD